MWIVQGATGEYDDYSDWVVCAYTTKEEAEKHAAAAERWWIHNREVWDNVTWDLEARETNTQNPYDPTAGRPDYNGTHYVVFEVVLNDEFVPVA